MLISCAGNYTWNQTGIILADTASSTIPQAFCAFLLGNDTFYICGHTLGFVQSWVTGGASRTAVTNNTGDHIDNISFDKNGNMYTNAHDKHLVRRCASKLSALLLNLFASNQIYISDDTGNAVYLWIFGAATPSITCTQVNCGSTLQAPRVPTRDVHGGATAAAAAAAPLPPWRQRRGSGNFFSFTVAARRGS
ncbi:unnamed protein product, partial [Rotaria magnacalcarata]